jgi:hypothetical protein
MLTLSGQYYGQQLPIASIQVSIAEYMKRLFHPDEIPWRPFPRKAGIVLNQCGMTKQYEKNNSSHTVNIAEIR